MLTRQMEPRRVGETTNRPTRPKICLARQGGLEVAEGEGPLEPLESLLKERVNKATVEDLLVELDATLESTDRELQAYVNADDNRKSNGERARRNRF